MSSRCLILAAIFIVAQGNSDLEQSILDPGSMKINPYNVLSIEGGGIRGIIPAVLIDYIESYAFQYAVSKQYQGFDKRNKDPQDRKRIQSKELFHMITGTASSAILTAFLIRPNDQKVNESYYAQDAIQFFLDEGTNFFTRQTINNGAVVIIIVVSALMGLIVGYRCGVAYFANPKRMQKLKQLKNLVVYLKEIKDQTSQPQFDIQSEDEPIFLNRAPSISRRKSSKIQIQRATKIFQKFADDQLAHEITIELDKGENVEVVIERKKTIIMANMQSRLTQIGCSDAENKEITSLLQNDTDDNMFDAISMLEQMQQQYTETKNKKWIMAALGSASFALAAYFLSIVIYNVAKPSVDRSQLQDSLSKKFARFKMTDAYTDEAVMIAYAYNQQQPRFYSKFEANRNPYIFDVQMDEATIGATSLLQYYDPYKMQLGLENTELLVDGSIIAQNPSFYSLIIAKELKKKKYVKVVSIGSGYSDFSGIDFSAGNFFLSVLSDPNYVIDVFSYIKARSHSYWTNYMLGGDKSMFYEFTFQAGNGIKLDGLNGQDMQTLLKYGEGFLAKNKENLKKMIKPIVDQKYGNIF